ncbi:MAG: peptidoglycan DD-metalloendopeptidase family protein [Alistipes sp.]|nr:peptidoglycan DD-metalloendopeptidase family protein [Alistipes sp.]
MKRFCLIAALLVAAIYTTGCSGRGKECEKEPNLLFGIDADLYNVERHTVQKGDTWGRILDSCGITLQKINRLDQLTREICPLRTIRIGKNYTTFSRPDSTGVVLDYLVYEKNLIDYVVFAFVGDSVAVREGAREVELRRTKSSAVIDSSLWGAIMDADMPYALAAEMEDIYQWTVDFFGIQKGDSFTVIYDEKFIDTLSVGIGRVWGAKFNHGGKEIYAIPFPQGGKVQYWEADGGSLRKQLLKAPLKFTRISSKFSYARLHPVLKKYRPHTGVDYAAPAGTPVRAVADGTVTFKGYKGAGGHTIYIKHPGNLKSGYLHLRGYAKGIAVGKRVSQGQVIGYVGSTGRSTGPHLDFRLWKGGTPINPLKVPQKPAEPISEQNKEKFEWVRERVMAELNGEVADSMRITQLDSITIN